ncbi:unnamed protein product, partial [Iphiclides podalirius]
MEDLNLTETEMRYFGDLFLCCDEESNGKIPILKATELFRSSNVPNDVLRQIMDISLLWIFPFQDSDVPQASSHDATEGLSTDSEIESETTSQRSGSCARRVKTGSPWSTASESPTPTNSVAERVHPVWEHSATGRGVWPTNTAEEHTRLLGTEEESSDRHSSEEEGGVEAGDEVWAISDVQANHYAAQFAQLRPERGLLSGQTARLFFEKSRLSVLDLRKIWQLSDITKDGMLTLEEFSIAMHLIVLRRNNVPVPDVLPACLVPKVDSQFSRHAVTTDLVDLGSDMFGSGTSADFNFAPRPETNDPYESIPPKKPDERPPSLTPPKPEPLVNNKEWTKFVDSPTSSVSSPGPKPVNFDFHKSAVERDPKIFHPVALRVTPDAGLPAHGDGDMRSSASPRRDDFAHAFELASPKRLNCAPPEPHNGGGPEIKAIQRPQPKKPLKSAGVLPPPPAREPSVHAEDGPQSLQYPPKKEPPPPPPPRPLRNHARSSSLDLNRLKGAPAPPPQPPPRTSPPAASPPARRLPSQRSEGEPSHAPDAFAPREYDGEGFGYNREDAPKMHGAFEVYRKASRDSAGEADPDVRALQEQNAVLHRVCRALCAELADVQREREALRVRLDAHAAPL